MKRKKEKKSTKNLFQKKMKEHSNFCVKKKGNRRLVVPSKGRDKEKRKKDYNNEKLYFLSTVKSEREKEEMLGLGRVGDDTRIWLRRHMKKRWQHRV